jgi:hypothetical protein
MEPYSHRVAAPGSIAHLDSVSDGKPRGQQSHPSNPQQPLDSSALPQTAPPGTAKQARVSNVDGGLPEHMQLDTRNSLRTVQEAQITDGQQYDNTLQLFPSDTVNVQSPGPLSENLHPVNLVQMPSSPPAATRETEVKQQPATDDHDLFSAFTNEDSHEEENIETEQVSNDVRGAVDQVPIPASIRSEPGIGDQVKSERAETVNSNVRADNNTPKVHVAAPLPDSLSQKDSFHSGAQLPETEAFPKRVRPETSEPHDMASTPRFMLSQSSSMATARDGTTQSLYEQFVQDSIQDSIDDQAMPRSDGRQRFTVPVEESQQHGSMKTGSSLGDMTWVPANDNPSIQLWQQRPQLSNTDPDFAHRMSHGPLPTSLQFDHVKGQQNISPVLFTGPSNMQSGNPSQRFSTSQPRVNTSYNGQLLHQPLSSQLPHAHPSAQRISSGHVASLQMSNPNWPVGYPFTSAGPIDPHNTQVDEEDVEMSDQNQALMVHKSSGDLDISADSVLGGRENLEDASDNDASNAESISWKLPSFEITYHGPEKSNENHEAAVSIPNLVRERVALTDDHHRQEMQLFLEVFLPAQRALQTPDPEPAHAVLNFHTISVMVLEAFVQWEIGDELGRGYGFHGGNTAMRPEPQGKEDDEPERIRSATDADVDEIFFTLVDRWRAGMLANKGTFKLIRGCQEFCDIALDVIHFIKEHGLLSPEEKERKERSDKGSVRGSKGDAEDSKGKRKADAGKVNNLPSRKKSKAEDDKEKKPVSKPKKKEKPTVSVVRKT